MGKFQSLSEMLKRKGLKELEVKHDRVNKTWSCDIPGPGNATAITRSKQNMEEFLDELENRMNETK